MIHGPSNVKCIILIHFSFFVLNLILPLYGLYFSEFGTTPARLIKPAYRPHKFDI